MTDKYEPKNGDRIRVVLEGEAGRVLDNGFEIGSGAALNFITRQANHVVSIEKIAPALPTTLGSVIRARTDAYPEVRTYILQTRDGVHSIRWMSQTGYVYHPAELTDIEILFTAPEGDTK